MAIKIIFSKHAVFQMKERSIDEKEVFAALAKPLKMSKDSVGKLKIIGRAKRNKKSYLLVVVAKKLNGLLKIITLFLTGKTKKYL